MTVMAEDKLLTFRQFYERHKDVVGKGALYKMVKEGRLEHVIVGKNRILIPEGALRRVKPPRQEAD